MTSWKMLGNSIWAEEVLVFLDRKSVLQLLEMHEFRDNMLPYYCQKHGTKLEVQEVEEWEEWEEDDTPLTTLDASKSQFEASTSPGCPTEHCTHNESIQEDGPDSSDGYVKQNPKKTCIDCIEAEKGNTRCPGCEDFFVDSEVCACTSCSITGCEFCENDMALGKCNVCGTCSCGRDTCPQQTKYYCESCDQTLCTGCMEMLCCKECCDEICEDCLGERILQCSACKDVFCERCREFFCCTGCDKLFCNDCQEPHFCHDCDAIVCGSCSGNWESCDDCRQNKMSHLPIPMQLV